MSTQTQPPIRRRTNVLLIVSAFAVLGGLAGGVQAKAATQSAGFTWSGDLTTIPRTDSAWGSGVVGVLICLKNYQNYCLGDQEDGNSADMEVQSLSILRDGYTLDIFDWYHFTSGSFDFRKVGVWGIEGSPAHQYGRTVGSDGLCFGAWGYGSSGNGIAHLGSCGSQHGIYWNADAGSGYAIKLWNTYTTPPTNKHGYLATYSDLTPGILAFNENAAGTDSQWMTVLVCSSSCDGDYPAPTPPDSTTGPGPEGCEGVTGCA